MLAADVDGDGWNDLILQTGSSVVVEYGDDQHTGGSNIVYDPVGPVAFAGGPNGPAVSMLGDGLSDFFIGGEWVSYLELTPSTTGTNVTSMTSLAAHTLVAQHVPPSGGSYAPATSNTFTVLPMGDVKPVLTLNPTSLSYNSGPLATTITATMQALSSTMPTGSITFYDNGNAIATATLSGGGVASATLTQPEAGTHTITSAYTEDSNYISETSVASTLTVVAETPGLTLSSSASSLLVGGVVTLTGSISSVHTNVAGEVLQFDIAGQNVTDCTITTSGSSGSCSVQIIIPSNGSLQAHVTNVLDTSGHPNLASTTSATAITGLQVAGDITIQSSTNSSYQGQSVTLTFTAPTLDGVTANGTANVYDNGTLLQAISFATSDTATITTTSLAVGTHTLTTHYNGDTNGRTFPNGSITTVPSFTAATGTSQLNQVVVTATLSLPLTITPQNTTEGTLQTLSVFVNNSGVGITGAVVQFFDANSNPTLLGSRTVGSTSPNTGIATWTQLFSPGTHNFYVVVTLPGAGLTTQTSSQVTGTVTPATSRALALNLSETGQPGSYTSTVVANYHSNYPLGALSHVKCEQWK